MFNPSSPPGSASSGSSGSSSSGSGASSGASSSSTPPGSSSGSSGSSSGSSTSSSPPDCPFCAIAAAHEPFDPSAPPASLPSDRTSPASFVVLATPALVAFLDIMPLSPGHLLLCPRAHRPKLTDASPAEARELGLFVRLLSAALARATGVADWNVVQNNGAAAAQVVPHMHFHLIPRPDIRASGRLREIFTMFGRGRREELDEAEAHALAAAVRRNVALVLDEERQQHRPGADSKL